MIPLKSRIDEQKTSVESKYADDEDIFQGVYTALR